MRNPLSQSRPQVQPESAADETAPAVADPHGAAHPMHLPLHALRKVPEITVSFWIIKLLTTAMGESLSDSVLIQFGVIGVLLGAVGLIAALVLQFSVRRYVPWTYWLAVSMVAIFGTMLADVTRVVFGISYLVSTAFFAVALAVIFVAWYAREKTLSIHSIDTRRREGFYWATVMAAFAVGTAAGDMAARTLNLGYLYSAALFTVLMAVLILCYRLFRLNGIVTFWFAYIVTRPIGASFADWLGRPGDQSGLGLGAGRIGLGLALVTIGFVASITVTHTDRTGE